MKIDDLKKTIRFLIREEVKKAVAEEVSKAMGKVLVEMVKEIKTNDKPRQIAEAVKEPLEEIIHTKNPRLNSVLAETARYSRPLQRTDLTANLAELMDGGFEKIGQTEDASYQEPEQRPVPTFDKASKNMDFLKQMVGNSPLVPQQRSVLDSGAVPDVLKGVFNKDFRSTMKKINEVAKTGGSGLISASQIVGG
jgi:hypothetical protein